MAIDYNTSAGLMTNPAFMGRTKIACLHFANYIVDEDPATPAHVTRIKWAQNTIQNADGTVNQIMPILIMDDKVQAAGSEITDPDLQSAVEASVNKTF